MRRVVLDVICFGLLIGLVEALPTDASIVIGLSIPVLIGFGRGFVEGRYLAWISHWIAGIEWATVVLVSVIVLCIPNSKSDPHDNFMTVFGAFFMIFIIPSVVLGVISFAGGLVFGRTKRSTR
jgi:hypothetical protein